MTPLAGSIYHIPGSTGSASNLDIPSFRGVFAFANQKGGVGKTTTAVSLAACLADEGVETLIVDFDPQGNASTGVGIDRRSVKVGTYEVLAGIDPSEGIRATEIERLSVLPSTIDLAGAEIELVAAFARESKLRSVIAGLRDRYAAILIDSPPSLGLLTINALVAADAVVVPIQCEYYALEGLGQLTRTLELVRDGLNPTLAIGGVVLTMYDARTRLAEQVVAEVRRYFGEDVFRSVIPRSVRLSEAPGFGRPITRYDPTNRGAQAYRDLTRELIARWTARRGATKTAEAPKSEEG
jgi:chromosome partitioning protein